VNIENDKVTDKNSRSDGCTTTRLPYQFLVDRVSVISDFMTPLTQTLHGEDSTDGGNSDSTSHSILMF